MILYNTPDGPVLKDNGRCHRVGSTTFEALSTSEDPLRDARALVTSGGAKILEGGAEGLRLRAPVARQEVWAAGVTYFNSRAARMKESAEAGGGSFYDRVYHAARPELFFKAQPHKVRGPGEAVRIRADSRWNIPEPEFTLLISPGGRITGYTIGNDMSSRDIEGENPLYLPQAKVYDGSCALGPGILLADEAPGPDTVIRLEIERDGATAFTGTTTLDQIKRPFAELAAYLYRENTYVHGAILLTGTGIIPQDDFSLRPGDRIAITIEPIGTLANHVE
ncbi:MAG: fumarylacetoacetate hydrolase family protein [Opitutales bacterium]|nr:fumarylacetoacetate hydrolase family protein [Opitutales bacterium]